MAYGVVFLLTVLEGKKVGPRFEGTILVMLVELLLQVTLLSLMRYTLNNQPVKVSAHCEVHEKSMGEKNIHNFDRKL